MDRRCAIEDIWEFAKGTQNNQGERHELGNMSEIRPYLDGLKRYDDVTKVIISSIPAIPAHIWVDFALLNSAVLTEGHNQVLVAGLVLLPVVNGRLGLWKTGREQVF